MSASAEGDIRLSIVFLNYNRLEETRLTVAHLRQLAAGQRDVEIVAVDNGSVDGTGDYLLRQEGLVTVLLAHNSGIAGYNAGFMRARGRYLLVLDDDSCPRDRESLERGVQILDARPEVGIVACRIENPDGTPQWSWHLPRGGASGPSPFFVGCGFFVRRELFEAIGWYPGDFFLYQNEIDVSFQVRLRGSGIHYDSGCRVVHRTRPSSRPGHRRVYYPTRNTIWLIRRYFPHPVKGYMLLSRLLIGLLRAISFGELPAYGRAVRAGFARPLQADVLPKHLRNEASPFFRQNSLWHQLLRRA